MTFLLVLGREPKISLAELEALFFRLRLLLLLPPQGLLQRLQGRLPRRLRLPRGLQASERIVEAILARFGKA